MSANKKDLVQAESVLENVDSATDNTKVKSESEKPVEKKPAAKKATKTTTTKTRTAAKKTEENVKETPATKTTTKKTPAKTTTKKTTTTKTPATTKKVTEPVIIVKIQYNGKEVDQQEIIERVKADWVAKGNDLKDMKTLATYIKPEEESVYYAVNDELNSGRIDF